METISLHTYSKQPRLRSNNHLIVLPRIVNKVGEWYQFPLGVAYISASAKKAGFKVFTLNLNNEDGPVEEIIAREIAEHDIGTVSTGGVTGQYGAIREVFEAAKRARPDVITIGGGGIISSAPETAMGALEVCDFGVIGEGEIIFCDLLQALENNSSTVRIPGLVMRAGNDFVCTLGDPAPVVLEDVPYPDYDGFGFRKLLESVPNIIGMSEYNTLPIVTGRSCPFKCTFCFHPSGQKFRQRELDDVFEEIDYMVREFGVEYLSIQDELFLFGRDTSRVAEFCRRIKPYGIKWLAQFRVCDVTPELIEMLKDGNCATMAFGIESADDTILKSMRKGIRVKQTEYALEMVYNAGIGIQGVLIFGDPAETMETAKRTLEWWKSHRQYELQLSAVITYPGTAIYKQAIEKGLIKDPEQYIRDGCPLVKLAKLTDEEYNWLFQQIASLPRLTHTQPAGVVTTSIDRPNARMNITGYCVSCNKPNHWEKSRLFITETLACVHCGRKHVAPIPDEVIQSVSDGLRELIRQHGKIAVWGVNSYIYSLFESVTPFSDDEIVFVDKSEMRHGLNIAGHRIRPVETIRDEHIDCVVVAVVTYYAGLVQPIREEFPHISKLLCISDLLSTEAKTAETIA